MPKGTLKKPKPTAPFEIVPITEQNSPKYDVYLKTLDSVFRNEGVDILLAASGFVCYVGLHRHLTQAAMSYHEHRGTPVKQKVYLSWFRTKIGVEIESLAHAERILSSNYTGRIWKTHLKGQQHDYFFYSRVGSIEETLDLIEVAKVMTS